MEITLNLWKRPDSYYGAEWHDYYVFLDQHRDSDSLTRSNFISAMKQLGGETETVQIVRESHWAVGWVEWIAIHKSDLKAIEKAQEIINKIDVYPVLDENHWSNLEYDEATAYWQSMRLCDRVELCKDAEISIFSARHEWIPQDDSGFIYERLTAN
jgi:hypothetical protein